MQSIRGYGFLLKAPDEFPEEEYQELKGSIERLCEFALRSSRSLRNNKLDFAILSKDSVFITISIRNGHSEFALYNKVENKIVQECTVIDFKRYVNQKILDALEYRIENECKEMAKGQVLDRKILTAAWDEEYKTRSKDAEELAAEDEEKRKNLNTECEQIDLDAINFRRRKGR